MSRSLKVAVAQIDTTVGDFAGNSEKILAGGRRAEEDKADLVLFPELAVCGYPPKDLLERRSFLEESERATRRLARASGEAVWLFVSLPTHRPPPRRSAFNAPAAAP